MERAFIDLLYVLVILTWSQFCRKPIKDANIGRESSKLWESLREIKDFMLIEDTNSPRGPAEYNLSQNSSARSSPGNSDSTGQHLGPSLLDKSHGNHEVVNSDKPKNIASSKSPVSTILYY